jgi:ubiquinone/menaquinone biosynthesis C-methylase UbiE
MRLGADRVLRRRISQRPSEGERPGVRSASMGPTGVVVVVLLVVVLLADGCVVTKSWSWLRVIGPAAATRTTGRGRGQPPGRAPVTPQAGRRERGHLLGVVEPTGRRADRSRAAGVRGTATPASPQDARLPAMAERRDEMVAAQYFAAVAGMAAMRHCLTRPSAVRARLDDVCRLVEHLDEFPNDLVVPVIEHDLTSGYDAWAEHYDGPNPAVEADAVVVHDLLAAVPPGIALDAACGTGRHSRHLADRGFEVIGVDANATMLARAEAKVPVGDFRLGDLGALPVDDTSVDVVVCSLALTHVSDLGPALAEFARVVRPRGIVIVSDVHPLYVAFGGAAVFPTASERFELHYVPNLVHPVSEYVRAAVDAGLLIRECREPVVPDVAITTNPAHSVVPEAVRQAFEGLPFLLVWRFERAEGPPASRPGA